jgi:recombinational DNA repair protein (RecF pathway)
MSARTISVNAQKVLRLWQRSDIDTARLVKLSAELAREIKGILRENVRYLLEKQLKSIEWLDRLAGDSKLNSDSATTRNSNDSPV